MANWWEADEVISPPKAAAPQAAPNADPPADEWWKNDEAVPGGGGGGLVRSGMEQPGGPGGGTYTGQNDIHEGMPAEDFAAHNRALFLNMFKSDPNAVGMKAEDFAKGNQTDLKNFGRGAADVGSWGTSDEIMAGLRGLNPWSKTTYEQRLAEERKALADSGNAGTAGQLVAGYLMPGSGVKKAMVSGGAYGFGSGEGGVENRMEKGLIGGMLSGAGSKVLGKVANWFKGAEVAPKLADDVFDAGNDLYNRAKAAGVDFHPNAVIGLANDLRTAADQVNRGLRPKTAGFIKDINAQMKGSLSLKNFDQWRQRIGKELGKPGTSADDARTLLAMKQTLDDFGDNLQPGQFSGPAATAIPIIKEARSTWNMGSKLRDLEQIHETAGLKGTDIGMTNGLKAGAENILKKVIKGKDNRWTDEEIAELKKVAKGGDVGVLTNFMRMFRPSTPTRVIAGQLAGGLLGSGGRIAAPLIGAASQVSANNAAIKAMTKLQRVTSRNGAPLPMAPQGKWLQAHSVGMPTAGVSQTPLDMLLSKPQDKKSKGGLFDVMMQ